MSDYERFKEFLAFKGIGFGEDAFEDGGKFVYFSLGAYEDETIDLYFSFNEGDPIIDVYIMNIAQVADESKRKELLEIINDRNYKRRYGTVFVNDQGEVRCFMPYVITKDEECFNILWDMIEELLDEMVNGAMINDLMDLKEE